MNGDLIADPEEQAKAEKAACLSKISYLLREVSDIVAILDKGEVLGTPLPQITIDTLRENLKAQATTLKNTAAEFKVMVG